ncbi:MAG: VOC family protein, partial [Alphaproteobacteria bacterium]
MARVVHFEIHAQEPERAIAFYEAVFGWRFNKWQGPMPYWLIETGSDAERGINGGLVERQGPAPKGGEPVVGFVCTVDIDDVDTYVDKAKA